MFSLCLQISRQPLVPRICSWLVLWMVCLGTHLWCTDLRGGNAENKWEGPGPCYVKLFCAAKCHAALTLTSATCAWCPGCKRGNLQWWPHLRRLDEHLRTGWLETSLWCADLKYLLLAGTSLVNNLSVHSWLTLACSSDYQDKQDVENHKMTLGVDMNVCIILELLWYLVTLHLVKLFRCE